MYGTRVKNVSKSVALAASLLVGAAAYPAADDFYFDYAFFYAPSGDDVVVEVYIAVPLDWLTPAESESGKIYNFNVGVNVSRPSDEAVVASRVLPKTAEVAASENVKAPLSISQVKVAVPPGDYRLTVGVGDVRGAGSRLSTVDLAVPPPAPGPFPSGIELATSVAPVEAGARGEFVKNGLNVIPNPTKVVSDGEASLPIYYELYRLPLEESGRAAFVVRYDVSQLNGRRFVRVERVLEADAPRVVRVDTLDLAGIPPGSYELDLLLEDRDGKAVLQAKKEFMVYHEYTDGELIELKGKFMPYSLEEEKQRRKELALVASEAELAAFDALPAEEKPIFVENFWERRDPDRSTPTNEFKNAFYQRYYYVQEHFTTPFREGVATDMGRVYLKYGEPDEILRSPMGMRSEVTIDTSTWQSEPFEAWEYYTAAGVDNQYVLFVFVDKDGDGTFELDASTVPGYGRLIRSD
ncbi:MAG: GWxTD domain-containing protein [candidate division Zixibacteria bacterium]|nr:GWxTD domain-containing protein [candidate division Zixibacteria bacterium]